MLAIVTSLIAGSWLGAVVRRGEPLRGRRLDSGTEGRPLGRPAAPGGEASMTTATFVTNRGSFTVQSGCPSTRQDDAELHGSRHRWPGMDRSPRRRDEADRSRGASIPGVLVTRPIMADDPAARSGRCPPSSAATSTLYDRRRAERPTAPPSRSRAVCEELDVGWIVRFSQDAATLSVFLGVDLAPGEPVVQNVLSPLDPCGIARSRSDQTIEPPRGFRRRELLRTAT